MKIEPAVSALRPAKNNSLSLRRLTKISAGISRPRHGSFRAVDFRDALGRKVARTAIEDDPALVHAEDAIGIFEGDVDLMQVDDQRDLHLACEPLQLLHDDLRSV